MKWPNIIGYHTMAWLAIAGLLLYLFFALFIPGYIMQIITSSMNLGVSVAVLLTWAPAATFAIRRKALGKNQLIIAVFTTFSAFVLARAYMVAYTYFDQPDWWPDLAIRGLLGYLVFCGGALFLIAPANIDEPEINYKWHLLWAIVAGTIVTAVSYWAQTIGWLS